MRQSCWCGRRLSYYPSAHRPSTPRTVSSTRRIHELKDIVGHKVTLALPHQLERLHVAHRPLLLVDEQRAGHLHEDTAFCAGGLCFCGVDFVLDFIEGEALGWGC